MEEEAGKLERRRGFWTEEEDRILTEYVKVHGKGKWNRVAKETDLKRCGKSCRLRWINYLNPGTKHGDFSEEEDDLIIRLHNLLGNRWSLIAGRVPGRTDNQVKNHWNTHLRKKLGMINKPDYKNTKTRRSSSRNYKKRPSCSKPQPPNPVRVVQAAARATGNLSSAATATTSESNSEQQQQPPQDKDDGTKKRTSCSAIQEDDGSKVTTTQDYDYCFSSPHHHQELITKMGNNNNEHYCYYDWSSPLWLSGDDDSGTGGGGGLIPSQPQQPPWMEFVNDYRLDFYCHGLL